MLTSPALDPAASSDALHVWQTASHPPAGWEGAMRECGGTFFQSPTALAISLPPGEPVYAWAGPAGDPTALALGVATRCRLARRPLHLRFAALPAVRRDGEVLAAAAGLARLLARRGAAEIVFDSFASRELPTPPPGTRPGRERIEFILPLNGDLEAGLSRTHRLNFRRGNTAGLRLTTLDGEAAVTLLARVGEAVAQRVRARGERLRAGDTRGALPLAHVGAQPWGMTAFACLGGNHPLAVAVVGWAAGEAYYLVGGSTPEGYRARAATWLHCAIARRLRDDGLHSYNLGGAPPPATQEGPGGLYEFKARFGALPRRCRGITWEARTGHLRLHRLLGRVPGVLA